MGSAAWAGASARQVRPETLRADVLALPAPRNRLHAPAGMAEADAMILGELHGAGWKAELQPFVFEEAPGWLDYGHYGPTTYRRLEGANVVAAKEGLETTDAVVVMAHHDTVWFSPGADDNGSGVAALLQLARVLGGQSFRRTVVLAATDMEELGFFGARALASSLRRHRLVGVINLETIGYVSSEPHSQLLPPGLGFLYPSQIARVRLREERADFMAIIHNRGARALAAAFAGNLGGRVGLHATFPMRAPQDLPLLGGLMNRVLPLVRNFTRGDHVPFWEAGVPALFVTDTANFRYRHYHQPTDTADKLDYDWLAAVVGALADTVRQVAGVAGEVARRAA